jgi:hypothetical protein
VRRGSLRGRHLAAKCLKVKILKVKVIIKRPGNINEERRNRNGAAGVTNHITRKETVNGYDGMSASL